MTFSWWMVIKMYTNSQWSWRSWWNFQYVWPRSISFWLRCSIIRIRWRFTQTWTGPNGFWLWFCSPVTSHGTNLSMVIQKHSLTLPGGDQKFWMHHSKWWETWTASDSEKVKLPEVWVIGTWTSSERLALAQVHVESLSMTFFSSFSPLSRRYQNIDTLLISYVFRWRQSM